MSNIGFDLYKVLVVITFALVSLLLISFYSVLLVQVMLGMVLIVDGSVSFAVRWEDLEGEMTVRKKLEFSFRVFRILGGMVLVITSMILALGGL